jgi:hypothetical protein
MVKGVLKHRQQGLSEFAEANSPKNDTMQANVQTQRDGRSA